MSAGTTTPVSGGTTVANYDWGIADFVVPANGVHTVRVTNLVDDDGKADPDGLFQVLP